MLLCASDTRASQREFGRGGGGWKTWPGVNCSGEDSWLRPALHASPGRLHTFPGAAGALSHGAPCLEEAAPRADCDLSVSAPPPRQTPSSWGWLSWNESKSTQAACFAQKHPGEAALTARTSEAGLQSEGRKRPQNQRATSCSQSSPPLSDRAQPAPFTRYGSQPQFGSGGVIPRGTFKAVSFTL